MSMQTLIGGLAVLLLGGASMALYAQNRELSKKIDRLEEARPLASASPADTDGPRLGDDETQAELRTLRTEMGQLAERMQDAETRFEKPASPEDGTASAAGTDSPAFGNAVRDIVLDMAGDVGFRAKLGLTGSPNLPKKPAFGQLADALKLDAVQEDAFRKELSEMQQDFFAIISEERDDGVVPLEEIGRAEELAQNDPQRAQIFIKLLSLSIPGSDETYLERMVDMTTAMRRRTLEFLRPEQKEIFNAIDVDWLGVKMD